MSTLPGKNLSGILKIHHSLVDTSYKSCQVPERIQHCSRDVEESHEYEPSKGGFVD